MTLPDLSMIRGDTVTFPLTLYGSDEEPLNLANLEITFTVKRFYSDSEPFITKTLDDGVAVVDEDAGTITVTLQPEDTADITFWSWASTWMPYVWDVVTVDADYPTMGEDAVHTRRRGVLRVYRGVTVTTA